MMAALVATVVASGFVIYAVSLGVLAGVDRDESLKETETLSTVAASTIRAVLREPVPMLESVARALGRDPTPPETILGQALDSSTYLESLWYLNRDAVVIYARPESRSIVGTDLSNLELIRQVRAAGEPRWSSVYAGLDEGRRELAMALPARDGYVVAVLDFERLAARVGQTFGAFWEDGRSTIALTDSGGAYIVHRDSDMVDRRVTDQGLLARRLEDPQAPSYSFTRDPGAVVVTAVRIPETGWYAIVERPASLLKRSIARSFPPVSIVAALTIALSLTLAVRSSRLLLLDIKAAGLDIERSGEPGQRMHFKETAAIRNAARAAANRIRAKEADNKRLEALNVRLATTLEELERAQEALVESERRAVRGTMASVMAHELNSPIAAADSAAGAASMAAVDILSFVERGWPWSKDASGSAAALRGLVDAYEPESAATGPERRAVTAALERELSGIRPDLSAVDIASRLADIGYSRADKPVIRTIRAALSGEGADAALSCLSAAEIVASCKVARAAMAKANAVVVSIKTLSEDPSSKKPLKLAVSLEEAVSLLYIRTKKGVSFDLKVAGDLWIRARPEALQRVWMSLLSNALEVMTYRGSLSLAARRSGERVVVRIEDSGPPVPSDKMQNLWDDSMGRAQAYERGSVPLALIRNLVSELGGDIQCASAAGRTSFIVSLPAVEAPSGREKDGTPA